MAQDTSTSAGQGVDIAHLATWEGRSETASDTIMPSLVAGFLATLDREPGTPRAGDVAPLGIHWCLALPTVPMTGLGPDGHPARGGFLPPVPLPRRMWAGGRLRFSDPLRVGDVVRRRSTVRSVKLKEGRTGPLVFVVVEHEVSTNRGPALTEEHDIVYRGLDASASPPAPAASADRPAPDVRREIDPSPVLLFRYSALTFNGHRIHYDRTYVTKEEGYPGLIVHGPLQATLLLNLSAELLGGPPSSFAFRAERPLFDLAPFAIEGSARNGSATLRVINGEGRTTVAATAEA